MTWKLCLIKFQFESGALSHKSLGTTELNNILKVSLNINKIVEWNIYKIAFNDIVFINMSVHCIIYPNISIIYINSL